MDLRQLEYFVAVVEEANFTRAAERVHISQSGVSAQIRQLERELGQPLLDRSAKRVRVTDAGAIVLPHARAALASADGIRQAVDELRGLVRGHVSVGMVTACSVRDLFDLLAEFHETNPGIDVTLTEDTSDRLVDALLDGRLDLALAGIAAGTPDGAESRVLADEALVAAVRHDDALAGRRSISVRKLLDRPIVCLPRGTGVRTAFDDGCASRNLQPRVAFEASAPDVVAGLAIRGLGVAVLSESMVAVHARELRAVAITDPRMRSRLELIWRADAAATPAARALVAHARRAASS
ncbi:MAG TPA: LysR substrate-binding domain-containing protein [Acidimicrobiia bacterium]|jgi:DNA-binding transcriptional LysR family regulator